MGRLLLVILIAGIVGCAHNTVYKMWGNRLDELPRQNGRADDVSMILGSPPTRCAEPVNENETAGSRV